MTHEDQTLLAVIAEQVKDIHKLVKGNGQPGLQQRTEALERWRSYCAGALGVIILLGGWAVVILTGRSK